MAIDDPSAFAQLMTAQNADSAAAHRSKAQTERLPSPIEFTNIMDAITNPSKYEGYVSSAEKRTPSRAPRYDTPVPYTRHEKRTSTFIPDFLSQRENPVEIVDTPSPIPELFQFNSPEVIAAGNFT